MTTNNDEYQGWTNRETWAANLWITNDEGLLDEATAQARQDEYGRALESWLDQLADEVQESPEECSRELRMMIREIGSLWRVNFKEIRDSLLED